MDEDLSSSFPLANRILKTLVFLGYLNEISADMSMDVEKEECGYLELKELLFKLDALKVRIYYRLASYLHS
jgi:hypothetical protein